MRTPIGVVGCCKGATEDWIDAQHAEEARGYLHGLDTQGLVLAREIEIGPQQSRRRFEQIFSQTELTKPGSRDAGAWQASMLAVDRVERRRVRRRESGAGAKKLR